MDSIGHHGTTLHLFHNSGILVVRVKFFNAIVGDQFVKY